MYIQFMTECVTDGSVFSARGAATEKAVSPIRERVRGTTRSPDDEDQTSADRVSGCVRQRLTWASTPLEHWGSQVER